MEITIIMKKNQWNNENILNEQIDFNNQPKLSYICPYCQQQIITLDSEVVESMIFTCPKCRQKGEIRPLQKLQNITNTNLSNHIIINADLIDERKNINIPAIKAKILGLLLIIIGIALQYVFNLLSFKITFALVIIGVIIFMFIPDNRIIFIKFQRTNNKGKTKNELKTHNYSSINYIYTYLKEQFDISERIAIVLILWIIFIYTLTGVNDIDIFFIFVYLGILLMKILTDHLISFQLKQRMNIFIVAFLLVFIIIVIKRIISIVRI